jgi:hypothetical protein
MRKYYSILAFTGTQTFQAGVFATSPDDAVERTKRTFAQQYPSVQNLEYKILPVSFLRQIYAQIRNEFSFWFNPNHNGPSPTEAMPITKEQIQHMVDRFLGWRLPKDFNPDAGISYTRPNYAPNVDATPSGTNLLNATQATAMVRYMIEEMPATHGKAA